MAYLSDAVARKAAAMVDERTGAMTPAGEEYLRVISGLWVPEETARTFAESMNRPWESLSEEARRELRDSFDALHPMQQMGKAALEARRAELVGMPTVALGEAQEGATMPAAFSLASTAPQVVSEALRWYAKLSAGYRQVKFGDAVVAAMRGPEPPEDAVARVVDAYEGTLAQLRAWWQGLPASVRLDYRRVYGASAANEMDLIRIAYSGRDKMLMH
jgi:citrate synthase